MSRTRSYLVLLALCFIVVASAAEPLAYSLKKGDTLYSLGRQYGVPVDVLMTANGIKDISKLQLGQKILIPIKYLVIKGDTLSGISVKFDMDIDLLLSMNKLTKDSNLKVGQSLWVLDYSKSGTNSAGTNVAQGSAKPSTSPKPSSSVKASSSNSSISSTGLSWPVSGTVSYTDGKLFGVKIVAKKGDSIRAVSTGVIQSIGPYRGFGQVIFIQTSAGYIHVYGGSEAISVKIGETIRAGTELGKLGIDLKENKAIAYFFVFKDNKAIDPSKAPR